jgi:hypothetical protein
MPDTVGKILLPHPIGPEWPENSEFFGKFGILDVERSGLS